MTSGAVHFTMDELRGRLPKEPRPSRERLDGRAVILGAIAGWATFEPTLALRVGAVAAGLVLLTRLGSLRFGWADALAVLLGVHAWASLNWALNGPVTELAAENQICVIVIFLGVRALVTSRRNLLTIGAGYLIGSGYALYLLVTENVGADFMTSLSDQRLTIGGLNANYLAYALCAGLAVAVLLWTAQPPTRRKTRVLLLATAVGAAVFGCIQLGTRGAAAGVVLLLAWLLFSRFLGPWRLRLLVAAVVVAGLAIVTGAFDQSLVSVDAGTARATGDLAGRLTTWPQARLVWGEHLWLGIGAGGFAAINMYGIGAHNVLLEIGTGLGLIGVVLFVALLFFALGRDTSVVPHRQRALLIGALVAATAPIYLSGHWELSPAGWVVMALFSRIAVLYPGAGSEAPGVGEVPGGVAARGA